MGIRSGRIPEKRFGTALFGLIGIAVLAAIGYALIVARFPNDRDPDTPGRIPGDTVALAEGMAAPALASNAASAVDADPAGITVYKKACIVCHGTGVANAPRLGDQAAWQPRMAQGIDRLLATSLAGKGAMPPRGTCADCSDDDLKAAIEYMLIQVGYEPAAFPGTTD